SYLGMVITKRMVDSVAEVLALASAAETVGNSIFLDVRGLEEDWDVVPPTEDLVRLYRLRDGIERFLITDINRASASATGQSQIALMWDNIADDGHFNHVPGGSNVLFLDGHVDFVR